MAATARDIDEYIASSPAEMRDTLTAVRLAIGAAAPSATEAIAYQIPTFKYEGRALVAFAAWKRHLSLYPMSYQVIDALSGELKGFTVVKGTVQFTPDRPLPAALLTKFVKARVAELKSAKDEVTA